jgi:hypothetical protein
MPMENPGITANTTRSQATVEAALRAQVASKRHATGSSSHKVKVTSSGAATATRTENSGFASRIVSLEDYAEANSPQTVRPPRK